MPTIDLFNFINSRAEQLRNEVHKSTPVTNADPLAAEHAASDAYQHFLAGASAVLEWRENVSRASEADRQSEAERRARQAASLINHHKM